MSIDRQLCLRAAFDVVLENHTGLSGWHRRSPCRDPRFEKLPFVVEALQTVTILLPAVSPTRSAVQWWEVDPAGAGTLVQRGRVDSGVTTDMTAHPSLAVSASRCGDGRSS